MILNCAPAQVWDRTTGELLGVRKGHTAVVRCVASRGKKIVSGGQDMSVRVWSLDTWKCLAVLEGHTGVVRGVAIQGDVVVSCSQDTSVRVWSVRGKREKRVLQGHDADVRGVALSGDGLTAVSCSFDKSVVVWDVKKGMLRERHEGHTDKVFGVALDRKGTRAVSCSWDMSLRVWDTGRLGARPAVLQPPSLGYGSRGGSAAPSSLLGARGPSEAVRVAAARQQSGGPAGAGAGEDVDPLLGPRKARVRVELREEARLPRALDPDDVDLLGDADEARPPPSSY